MEKNDGIMLVMELVRAKVVEDSYACDITRLKLVKNYDGLGRAVFSEWPTGWRESLERRYAGGASSTFHAVGFRA
jgi:hypothetical protein